MTNPDTLPTAPTDSSLLVVEAFIDGEAIDLDALRDALARSEGRDHLVELLALREAVWRMAPRGYSPVERTATRVGRGVRWLAVAAAVLLSVSTGYLAGRSASLRPAESGGVEAMVDMMDVSAAPPPQPTHVIPLRPGVNWTETPGGR